MDVKKTTMHHHCVGFIKLSFCEGERNNGGNSKYIYPHVYIKHYLLAVIVIMDGVDGWKHDLLIERDNPQGIS